MCKGMPHLRAARLLSLTQREFVSILPGSNESFSHFSHIDVVLSLLWRFSIEKEQNLEVMKSSARLNQTEVTWFFSMG